MIKKRIAWLDQLRAISMFFVVLGHCALEKENIDYIYAFHMPLFFIISGMTFNPNKYENLTLRIKDKFKKLLIPHFYMNLLMLPMWIITFKIITKAKPDFNILLNGIFYINSGEYQTPSNATWFLAALFLTDILFYIVYKFSSGDTYRIVIATCVIGIIGFLQSINKHNYNGPWHVEAVPTALVFFMVGYFFMKNLPIIESKLNKLSSYILICVLLYIVGNWCATNNGRVSMNGNNYDSILYFYTAAFCLSFLIIFLVMKIPKLTLLSYIGQNTLLYVGIHIPIIRIIERTHTTFMTNPKYAVFLAILVYFIMVPVIAFINIFAPFIGGKKWKQNFFIPEKALQIISFILFVIWFIITVYLFPYIK